MKYSISLLVFFTFLLSCFNNNAQEKNLLEPSAYREKMIMKKNFHLIDVRTSGEFQSGYLDGAQNIDINGGDFEQKIAKLSKDKPVFVYCLSGGRSAQAQKIFLEKGFKEVYNMQGGILAWKSSNFPLAGIAQSNGWKGMTKEEFNKQISGNIPVLVDFKAKWCGPCKQLAPVLESIAKEYEGKIKILMIDIDENKSLADEMKIRNIPLMVYYKGQKVAMNLEGFMEKQAIIKSLGL